MTTPKEPRELLALKVDEVSLVDKPAIRRKFSLVKNHGEVDLTKKIQKGEITEDVVKAATPLLMSLAGERLGLITSKVDEIKTSLGTMSKDDASEALYSLQDLIWGARCDVIAISKSVEGDASPTVAKMIAKAETEIEKAHPRKMTKRRLSELKLAAQALEKLAKEFESETEDPEEEDPMPTEKNEEAVAAAVNAAVAKAFGPLEERLKALEKPAEKAAEPVAEKPVEKAVEPTEPAWVVKLTKSLESVGQRLDVLEGSSNAGGGNRTETKTTEKAEKNDWSGIL